MHSAVEILLRCYSLHKTMYRPAKSVDWCQCCQQRVAFSNFEGFSDFFGNYNTPAFLNTAYNPCCGTRHLRWLSKAFLICRPRPLAQVACLRHRRRSHRSPVAFIVYLSPFTIHLTGGRRPPLHCKFRCVLVGAAISRPRAVADRPYGVVRTFRRGELCSPALQ